MNNLIKCRKINPLQNLFTDSISAFGKNFPVYAINHFMGKKPPHFPKTKFQIAYENEAIFIVFTVHDQFVISKAERYQGEVWKDSCVEFFFTPGTDINSGYFNLEVNCSGKALFCFQKSRGVDVIPIMESDFNQIEIIHSIPEPIKKELIDPVTWTLAYRLPFKILEKYTSVTKPGPGVFWKTNFYKCADGSSQPHWLTWAKICKSEPDFHRPEFFGTLEFD